MKRIAVFCLAFLILFPAKFAWGSENINAETNDDMSTEKIPGFAIENDVFYALEDSFFQSDFIGTMSKVNLSETNELVFNPAQTGRLLPNLYITMPQFEVDTDSVSDTVKLILGTMDYLQERFPESFLFNIDMMAARAGTELAYLVAEPDIWLWNKAHSAAMIPVFFYNNESGELVDGIYLLEIITIENGAYRCALYNNPKHFAKYMTHVTIHSDSSPFQNALAQWYLQNYYLLDYEKYVIGTVRVVNTVSHVGDRYDLDANVMARVRRGEEFPVLGKTENGWYLIRYAEDAFGFIPPKGVEFFPKK